MLKHAFGPAAQGIYCRTRIDWKFFNLFRLRAKTKVQLTCLHDFLFADNAAVTAHSAEDLQQLMTRFSNACFDFGLTISLKKTQVMGQDVDSPTAIGINDHELDVTHDFVIWTQLLQTPFHLTQSSTGTSARQLPPWPDQRSWNRDAALALRALLILRGRSARR